MPWPSLPFHHHPTQQIGYGTDTEDDKITGRFTFEAEALQIRHAKKFKGNVIYWYKSGDIFACTFSVFRPKNTNTVTVNNLIYYEKNNYNVNYYENGNKILDSGINENITFFNLNSGKHTIGMIYKKDGTLF